MAATHPNMDTRGSSSTSMLDIGRKIIILTIASTIIFCSIQGYFGSLDPYSQNIYLNKTLIDQLTKFTQTINQHININKQSSTAIINASNQTNITNLNRDNTNTHTDSEIVTAILPMIIIIYSLITSRKIIINSLNHNIKSFCFIIGINGARTCYIDKNI